MVSLCFRQVAISHTHGGCESSSADTAQGTAAKTPPQPPPPPPPQPQPQQQQQQQQQHQQQQQKQQQRGTAVNITFAVKDTGPGIETTRVNDLFQKYWRHTFDLGLKEEGKTNKNTTKQAHLASASPPSVPHEHPTSPPTVPPSPSCDPSTPERGWASSWRELGASGPGGSSSHRVDDGDGDGAASSPAPASAPIPASSPRPASSPSPAPSSRRPADNNLDALTDNRGVDDGACGVTPREKSAKPLGESCGESATTATVGEEGYSSCSKASKASQAFKTNNVGGRHCFKGKAWSERVKKHCVVTTTNSLGVHRCTR